MCVQLNFQKEKRQTFEEIMGKSSRKLMKHVSPGIPRGQGTLRNHKGQEGTSEHVTVEVMEAKRGRGVSRAGRKIKKLHSEEQ